MRGLLAVSAAAGMFIAGWMLHGHKAHDRLPVDACMMPSTPENTHYISLDDLPADIIVLDYKLSLMRRWASARDALHIVESLPASESITFHVQDGEVSMTLRME